MIDSLYECFQHWSENGSVYIISDLHFEDADCKTMDNNWIEPQEQFNILKKIVHKTDCLIVLGDVGNVDWLRKLKCYKVLIMGNHDESRTRFTDVFDEVYEGALFISEKILLSHEPIHGLDWCLNIHGHDHNTNHKGDKNHLNLAANVCGYTPISLGKLIKNGGLSKIKDIHRICIDNAIKNPVHKK